MSGHRIVVIGGSAGAIEALRALAMSLPPNFPAPLCVVIHISPDSPGMLPAIVSRAGRLPAEHAKSGERMQPGHFYIAPADHHLVIEDGLMRLTKGPKENRFRPAVDPLFRSAAHSYAPGAIGVVLSGGLDDGTAGLLAIKQLGGITVVQDPEDAAVPSMPASAVRHVQIDHCVPIAEMGPLLTRLVALPVPEPVRPVPQSVEVEVKIAKEKNPIEAGITELGQPSSFACPECHGVLLHVADDGVLRFRCHTGHAYSAETLVAAIDEGIESSLWGTVRALEEAQILMRQLADHATQHHPEGADELMLQAERAARDSEAVRKVAMARKALNSTTA